MCPLIQLSSEYQRLLVDVHRHIKLQHTQRAAHLATDSSEEVQATYDKIFDCLLDKFHAEERETAEKFYQAQGEGGKIPERRGVRRAGEISE